MFLHGVVSPEDTTIVTLQVDPWLFLTVTGSDQCAHAKQSVRQVFLSGATASSPQSQGARQYYFRTSEIRLGGTGFRLDRDSP